MDDQAALFRSLAAVVNRSMGGNANMENVWPLFNDPKETIAPQLSEEDVKAMVARANQIFAQ